MAVENYIFKITLTGLALTGCCSHTDVVLVFW